MRRRRLVRTGFGIGVALLAGCSSGGAGTTSDEEVVTGTPSELLPATELIREQVPGGTEWQEADDGHGPVGDADAVRSLRRPPADDATAEYVAEDPRIETAGRVTVSIRLADEVDRARELYDDHPNQDYGFDEATVAAESIAGVTSPIGKHPQARALFREANAVGWVSYWDRHVAAAAYEPTAIDLAELANEQWRSE